MMKYNTTGEAVTNYLGAVGIRTRVRTMERAAFYAALATKKLKGICVCVMAVYGNASSRLSETVPGDGAFAYGSFPDLDELYRLQADESDVAKREAMLHKLQMTLHERRRFVPIYDYIWASGVGPRVEEPALMHKGECAGQREKERQTFRHWKPAPLTQNVGQRLRLVISRAAVTHGIGQFQNGVVKRFRVIPSDLEKVNQAFVSARHGLIFLDARQLPKEWALFLKAIAPDHLHRAQRTHDVPRQPNFAITTVADQPQDVVIRHIRSPGGLIRRIGDWQNRRHDSC